ncbi:unnamed protein product [Microthlaspi erraticum]|uniref:Reverse transcriptase zinc-binding domain-containing protein n=1 Tax=Microthlaspi erraticum TaxID=1685480 RepID=A0A6D2KZ01_9BRAS|nr:unnamed protein product [Microthlaspi erraticum]
MLKLRQKALQFLKVRVGRGDSTFFWWDPWTPFGPLHAFLGEDGPSRLGIPTSATVSDIWNGSGWTLPHARSERQVLLYSYLLSYGCSPSADTHIWSISGSPQRSFSLKAVWNEIRPKKPEVNWAPLLWHKAGLPRHQTITWLFLLNRSPTLDRMSAWGYDSDGTCLLCGIELETRDHLFFECSFSASVWRRLMFCLNLHNVPGHWAQLLDWLTSASLDTTKKLALLQDWQGAVYELWKERNRLHDGVTFPYGKIFSLILSSVRDKCRAMSMFGSSHGDSMLQH